MMMNHVCSRQHAVAWVWRQPAARRSVGVASARPRGSEGVERANEPSSTRLGRFGDSIEGDGGAQLAEHTQATAGRINPL